jgi:RNA-binding protein YhbY
MALQPISSLHFQPLNQTKTHAIFKFALSCSKQTPQVQIKVVKKKKKNNSRPSFTHQIRDKWSLKLGSQRQKFPWQEQEEKEPELEEQPQSKENESSMSNYPLNFEFPKRLSPWHVAENSKHPQNDSEFVASKDNEENKKPLQQNSGGSVMEREVQESESSGLKKRRSNTELAEKLIPEHELRRLRNIALRMVERFSVGVAGITQELVDSIHEKWIVNEVVKFKFDSPLSANMKRAHQILEVHSFFHMLELCNQTYFSIQKCKCRLCFYDVGNFWIGLFELIY